MSARGVVLSNLLGVSKKVDGNGLYLETHFNRSLLCKSLLYWDRIDVPDSNYISVRLPEECGLLFSEGVLSREVVNDNQTNGISFISVCSQGSKITLNNNSINGKPINEYAVMERLPALAFEKLSSDSSTLWSFGQTRRYEKSIELKKWGLRQEEVTCLG